MTDSTASTVTYYRDTTQGASSNEYTAVGNDAYTYDANGNLINDSRFVYVYDPFNRLSEIKEIIPGQGAAPSSSPSSSSQRKSLAAPSTLTLSQIGSLLRAAKPPVKDLKELSSIAKTSKTSSRSSATMSTATTTTMVDVAYYGYDFNNRRVFKYLPSSFYVRWYAYDGWQNTDEFDAAYAPMISHFDGQGIDEHLGYAVKNGSSWDRYSYIQGHQGSVVRVVDNSGTAVEKYEYDPYGNCRIWTYSNGWQYSLVSGVNNSYTYTGRRIDPESGLMYFRNRYYSPKLGRFMTNDPIGIWGDGYNWGNGYGYCGNRVPTFNDPSGLYTIVVIDPYDPQLKERDTGLFNESMAAAKQAVYKNDPEGGEIWAWSEKHHDYVMVGKSGGHGRKSNITAVFVSHGLNPQDYPKWENKLGSKCVKRALNAFYGCGASFFLNLLRRYANTGTMRVYVGTCFAGHDYLDNGGYDGTILSMGGLVKNGIASDSELNSLASNGRLTLERNLRQTLAGPISIYNGEYVNMGIMVFGPSMTAWVSWNGGDSVNETGNKLTERTNNVPSIPNSEYRNRLISVGLRILNPY